MYDKKLQKVKYLYAMIIMRIDSPEEEHRRL